MYKIFKVAVKNRTERLIELDQNKTYAIIMEDMTRQEQYSVELLWKQAKLDLDWTPPKLMIINKNLVELIKNGENEGNASFEAGKKGKVTVLKEIDDTPRLPQKPKGRK